MGKKDRMLKAAQQYSCPWCSRHSGFGSGLSGVSNITSAMARDLVSVLRRPESLLTPAIAAHCLDCRESVAICGYCDHPNRHTGIDMTCDNCRKHINATNL